ncbi:hypothetical protein KKF82_05120, partial [Patescibacteria group bacterium]|nr:hypothetical protein [Patescibacteria group bacterium]
WHLSRSVKSMPSGLQVRVLPGPSRMCSRITRGRIGGLMLTLDVEFSVYCECGENLTDLASTGGSTDYEVTVSACPACCDDAREEGREEGNDDSFQEGYDAGYIDGRKEALDDCDAEDPE